MQTTTIIDAMCLTNTQYRKYQIIWIPHVLKLIHVLSLINVRDHDVGLLNLHVGLVVDCYQT